MTNHDIDSILANMAEADCDAAERLHTTSIPAYRFAEVLLEGRTWTPHEEDLLRLPHNASILRSWQAVEHQMLVAAPQDAPNRLMAALLDLITRRCAGGIVACNLRVAIAWLTRSAALTEQETHRMLAAVEEAVGLPNRPMVFRSSGEKATSFTWSCDQETVVALWNDSASLRLAFGSDSSGKQLAMVELRTDHDDRDLTVAFTHRLNGRVNDRFVIRANGPPVVLPLNSGQHEYIVDVTTAGGETMQHSIRKAV